MTAKRDTAGTFTGRHMLFSMLAFFAVIISVNLLMATLANTSWTGLVVKNTYVASQQFNRKAEEGRAQAALGWTGGLKIENGEIRYGLTDADGRPVMLKSVTAAFRHPAYEAKDVKFALAAADARTFRADRVPQDGQWIVEIDADAGMATPYRDVRRIVIAGGAMK